MMTNIARPILSWLMIIFLATPPNLLAQQAAAPAAFKQEELDQLVAPIALHPDSLVSQILMASTYPLEIVTADRFAKQNKNLKGDALTKALEQQTWDPSVKSLVNFPQVLTMMSEKLDWTQKLGDAFLADQKAVLNTIQSLRVKAQAAGNLKTTKEQTVIVEEKIIKMRFGLQDGSEHTLEEVGQHFAVTRERIRQIEAKALRKLRHPSRSHRLRAFLDTSAHD